MEHNQTAKQNITIYTDGSSLGNPGPGGWGAIMIWEDSRKEFSEGYRQTTNNRMEIRGVLHALEQLSKPCNVSIHTDSRYVCDAVEKRWIQNWLRNGWKTAGKQPVKNRDLWERLIPLLKTHDVRFFWIKAHAGPPENERCEELAKQAAMRSNMPADDGYRPES